MRIEYALVEIPIVYCAITGIVLLGRLHSSARLLAVHALLSAFTECIGLLMAGGNNHHIFTAYLPVDFFLITLACRDFLRREFLPLFVAATATFLGVYIYILVRRGHEFLPFEAIVTSWIIQSIFWFLVLLRALRQPLQRNSIALYFIAGGIMLYTCTSIPMWAMFRYNLSHHPDIARTLQYVTNISSMIRYIACGIGFILLAEKQITIVRHAVR